MLHDRVVAHRGYQQYYPENTLLGIMAAYKAGARYIETDIQFSADFVPVLYHDMAMKRISGIESFVSELAASQLFKIPAYEPQRLGDQFADEKIASLEQLIQWVLEHPDVTVFVEVKETAIAFAGIEKTYSLLEKLIRPVASQIVLISFDKDFIQYCQQQALCRVGPVLTDWSDLETSQLKVMAPHFVFCDKNNIPESADLNEIESVLVVYEVTDAEQAVTLFRRGVDMVETFNPAEMLAGLASHTL